MKNFIRLCIIGILSAIIRYIFIEKIGLDIKETYDFFVFFISTGIFVGIINLTYEDIYMSFCSDNASLPVGSGNIGSGVGGANTGNQAVGQSNPSAVNPAVDQSNPSAVNPAVDQSDFPD
jgi:hypothetical protein